MAPTEVKEMLGARIAALRRQAGMNQGELAKKLGISPSTVGMYEQGPPGAVGGNAGAAGGGLFRVHGLFAHRFPGPAGAGTAGSIASHALAGAEQQLSRAAEPPFTGEELTLLLSALLRCP